MSLVLCLKERHFTKPTTTDRLPTASHRPTDPPTHQQSTNDQPTSVPPTHRPLATDPLTGPIPTYWLPTIDHWPTNRCSTNPPTTDHRPTDKCSTDPPTTDHRLTDRSSIDPSITNSPTHRPYYNWPLILWLANLILTKYLLDQFFQQLISSHHSEWAPFITELVKLFINWLIKKNVDKLQILFIIPFGNWYLRIKYGMRKLEGHIVFPNVFFWKIF